MTLQRCGYLLASLCLASTQPVVAIDPQVRVPGYGLTLVSAAVPAASIAQMAFRPGDDTHLFAVTAGGTVVRYDYDPVDGQLSAAVTVAQGLGQALGLAFHGSDLYVSMDLGGSLAVRPGDGRITRLTNPDLDGVYQVRHDFVHSIDKGAHDINQLKVVGHTLFVGIGAAGRKGDPEQEHVYTMTVARIGDLREVDFSGPIDADFKGPSNALADEAGWLESTISDGRLRYYASGFRNPFGIAVDDDGGLWVSTNGNSDAGFLSHDYLYGRILPGDQGNFPPESFGYPPPHIIGTPVAFVSDLGQNPSPTGLDFVPAGPDQGKVVLAQAGASDQVNFPVGRDVLLVDPASGAFEVLIDGFTLPTDVQRDPFGRLLISDLGDGSVWLLVPPPAESPAGAVPDGAATPGAPLRMDRGAEGLTMTWGPSCAFGDDDYAVYEGELGRYYTHRGVLCTTEGAISVALDVPAGDRYYLIVPTGGSYEGSAGRRSGGAERPVGAQACLPRGLAGCP